MAFTCFFYSSFEPKFEEFVQGCVSNTVIGISQITYRMLSFNPVANAFLLPVFQGAVLDSFFSNLRLGAQMHVSIFNLQHQTHC